MHWNFSQVWKNSKRPKTHTGTRAHGSPLASPHQQYSRRESLTQNCFSPIVAGIYTRRPAWPGALVSFSPREQSCVCPRSVSLLSFHLQVTEGPQKSDPSLLGLIIPLDPQNTWCCCGVTKHPLPALGVCQSLKAQNKLSTRQRNSRKSWRCGKDRGTQPQRGPVHFQKCHQALLLS